MSWLGAHYENSGFFSAQGEGKKDGAIKPLTLCDGDIFLALVKPFVFPFKTVNFGPHIMHYREKRDAQPLILSM